MDVHQFLDNVHELTDLELAVLLSLIAQQHCLITTDDSLVDDLASELALIVSERFGLSYVVLEAEDQTSVDQFGKAILEDKPTEFDPDGYGDAEPLHTKLANVNFSTVASNTVTEQKRDDDRTIVSVVIAKGFNFADYYVQVQAIEMITNKRIFSRTTVHTAPKTFLFLPIVTNSSRNVQLIPHLNDRISISHHHLFEDGFANTEELHESGHSDQSSGPSQRSSWEAQAKARRIPLPIVDKLRGMGHEVTMTPEVRRYLQDIAVFLRMERGVGGGVTPKATTQFVALTKYLAPLHGITFATPSLVALAARKIYPHRIIIAAAERERSLQYGSTLEAVSSVINGLTPQDVIESVLATVQPPM